jgi:D-galactose 1-dehydrogenase
MTSGRLEYPKNWLAPIAVHLAMATLGDVPISAEFDFRRTGPQQWDIQIDADAGSLLLSDGGNTLQIDGVPQPVNDKEEYPALYRHFAKLVHDRQSDADLAPLRLVADAFLLARTIVTGSFD